MTIHIDLDLLDYGPIICGSCLIRRQTNWAIHKPGYFNIKKNSEFQEWFNQGYKEYLKGK